jgi:hypothetical protein
MVFNLSTIVIPLMRFVPLPPTPPNLDTARHNAKCVGGDHDARIAATDSLQGQYGIDPRDMHAALGQVAWPANVVLVSDGVTIGGTREAFAYHGLAENKLDSLARGLGTDPFAGHLRHHVGADVAATVGSTG